MKRIFPIIFFLMAAMTTVRAQFLAEPNKPYSALDYTPGYITITEFDGGFNTHHPGLVGFKSFYGFTTVHGYQFDKNVMAGGGAGAWFYPGGTIIPVYLHLHYNFIIRPFTPYSIMEAGVLFDSKSSANLFINPGIGVMYALGQKVGINLGACLLLRSGQSTDSFVNVRLGLTFKPAKRGIKKRR